MNQFEYAVLAMVYGAACEAGIENVTTKAMGEAVLEASIYVEPPCQCGKCQAAHVVALQLEQLAIATEVVMFNMRAVFGTDVPAQTRQWMWTSFRRISAAMRVEDARPVAQA